MLIKEGRKNEYNSSEDKKEKRKAGGRRGGRRKKGRWSGGGKVEGREEGREKGREEGRREGCEMQKGMFTYPVFLVYFTEGIKLFCILLCHAWLQKYVGQIEPLE